MHKTYSRFICAVRVGPFQRGSSLAIAKGFAAWKWGSVCRKHKQGRPDSRNRNTTRNCPVEGHRSDRSPQLACGERLAIADTNTAAAGE